MVLRKKKTHSVTKTSLFCSLYESLVRAGQWSCWYDPEVISHTTGNPHDTRMYDLQKYTFHWGNLSTLRIMTTFTLLIP